MATVRDLFVECLALKAQGKRPLEIVPYLVQRAQDEGLGSVTTRGLDATLEIEFPNGDIISFDGSDWHHDRG
jgi:hypothetical protein